MTICILPADIITEILSRLPVKSLLKLTSVWKSWLSLISSPEFINTHLRLSSKKEDTHHVLIMERERDGMKRYFKECPVTSLFNDSVTVARELDYPMENDPYESLCFMGSCNGLICLACHTGYSVMWNPTTKKRKNLPVFRPRWRKYDFSYGFGYDELHRDYKVVGVFYNYRSWDDVEVKVYSLMSDSWTSVEYCDETFPVKNDLLYFTGLFVDGKIHWVTRFPDPDPNVCKSKIIIAFDLANEKWEKVEKPSYGVGEMELELGVLGSDLSVFCDYEGTHIVAWVMKEYGVKESWIKMFTIRYPNSRPTDWYPPFFMSTKGEILAVYEYNINFMIYNSKDDLFRHSNVTNCDENNSAEFYIESLVCPFST